jgi:hypothetical protein
MLVQQLSADKEAKRRTRCTAGQPEDGWRLCGVVKLVQT